MDAQTNHLRYPIQSIPIALLVLATLFCGGCSSNGASKLIFQSADSSKIYSQEFQKAYYNRTDDGEYEIVLIQDGIGPSKSSSSGPILTSSAAPLSQFLQIRIFWKPLNGSKPDTPSATNAIIDWYVQSNESPIRSDRLHYRGAGFISIYDSTNHCLFAIRSSRLELADQSGVLQDPLGTSTVTGSFTAFYNRALVASTLHTLHEPNTTARPLPTSDHEGPPARMPTGP